MGFTEAIKSVLSKYAIFSGRARRSEFWYFFLFKILVMAVLSVLIAAVRSLAFLEVVFELAVLIPSLAVFWRRMHDIGKSGWWILLALIPIVGEIIHLIWLCTDSNPGDNEYGPNPKH